VLERRDRILAAATELFSLNGYGATTMSDVVTVVGGSKATLYRYFPSKEALLRATLDKIAGEEAERFSAFLDRNAAIDKRIGVFCRDYMRHLSRPDIIKIRRLTRAEAGRSDIGRRIYEEMVVPAWRRIADVIGEAMTSGALRKADPWRAAMHLKSLLEGDLPELLVSDFVDPAPDARVAALAAEVADVFLRAYAPEHVPR
jgi:AcrR family transcriptional regulator